MISLLGKKSIDMFSASNCKYLEGYYARFFFKPEEREYEWWCVGTEKISLRNLYILVTPDCFDLPRVGRNYQRSIAITGNII